MYNYYLYIYNIVLKVKNDLVGHESDVGYELI